MENSDLLTILEQLERDKGIPKQVLIEAVQSAITSAARKLWTVDRNEDIRVELDPKTGALTAYAGDEVIRSSEFGRIAAQTARQVVIQKIREAEKDVIYNEYKGRIGDVVTGSIYRFERGVIIVDLGKTEGFIPRSQQSYKENFRQGERVCSYILDVKRDTKGPQVVLSRSNVNFVKRLFQIEVPEILDGIVEIKSIARDVGERTKIAVYSKDEKIDCVGSCVGMRGARVKNIVSELQGEKIDIVRYSDDMKEFIQASLSPAEISRIQLSYDEKKANVIVADDQLSLAIGKNGQNVRLAGELVGWELNLFSFKQWQELEEKLAQQDKKEEEAVSTEIEEQVEEATDEAVIKKEEVDDISKLNSINEKIIEGLRAASLDSIAKIAEADIKELLKVKGLGKVKAQKLIDEAKSLINE